MLSLEWLYNLDVTREYSLDTKQGSKRLDVFIKYLHDMLGIVGVKLPTKPRVLCLMAGSCIEGIAFAQLFQAQVTCLDVQNQMLAKGAREAKRRKLKLTTVIGDARESTKHVNGRFDLVTLWGSPLAHLSIFDFDQVAAQTRKLLTEKGLFLAEQEDLIFEILPRYKDAMVANVKPPVINVHVRFSPVRGYLERLFFSRSRHELSRVYLWSPWIVEYVLRKNEFSRVKIQPYPDPFLMRQTYVTTGQK